MRLPDWKTDTAEKRVAFTRWIHAELDRRDAEAAMSANNPAALEFIQNRQSIMKLAREVAQPITFPEARRKPAAPKKPFEEYTALDWAKRDVPRIRALFRAHWGKRNRMERPMAEEIPAERWELSRADTARLINKFQRRS